MKLRFVIFFVWLILVKTTTAKDENKEEKNNSAPSIEPQDEDNVSKNDTKKDNEKLPDTITIVS